MSKVGVVFLLGSAVGACRGGVGGERLSGLASPTTPHTQLAPSAPHGVGQGQCATQGACAGGGGEGGWESWSVAQAVAVVPVADGVAVDAAITCRAPSLRAAAPRGRGRKQLVREGESS